jgi:hypothetical protein
MPTRPMKTDPYALRPEVDEFVSRSLHQMFVGVE